MTLIISLLMALGLVSSPEEFNNLSAQEQSDLTEIVIVDEIDM